MSVSCSIVIPFTDLTITPNTFPFASWSSSRMASLRSAASERELTDPG